MLLLVVLDVLIIGVPHLEEATSLLSVAPKTNEAPAKQQQAQQQNVAVSLGSQAADKQYFELMGQLLSGNNGSQLAQCLKQQQHTGWETRDSTFLTVGIEGSGHHLISLIKASSFPAHEGNTSNWQPCNAHDEQGLGCQFSFPCGRWAHTGVSRPDTWPEPELWTKETGACPTLAELTKLGKVPADSNYVVMLRDPISSFTSSLARFWDGCGDTSFDRLTLADDMAEHEQSAAEMDEFVRGLPCDRTLILSYEMLLQFPEMHRASLAAFLNVQPGSAAIEDFFSQFDHFLISQLSK